MAVWYSVRCSPASRLWLIVEQFDMLLQRTGLHITRVVSDSQPPISGTESLSSVRSLFVLASKNTCRIPFDNHHSSVFGDVMDHRSVTSGCVSLKDDSDSTACFSQPPLRPKLLQPRRTTLQLFL